MKRRIKKLLYSSLAALISIGVNFDVEARVTREVAEAVLPYLMQAAGIPEDEQGKTKGLMEASEDEPSSEFDDSDNYSEKEEGLQQVKSYGFSSNSRSASSSPSSSSSSGTASVSDKHLEKQKGTAPNPLSGSTSTTTTSFSSSSSSSSASSSSLSASSSSATHVPNYSVEKRKAILDMIYTDEGQQQMVKWVQTGEFPDNFQGKFLSSDTYLNESYRKATLFSLFPCQTGTFTSFANHQSRFGLHILSNDLKKSEYITKFLLQRDIVDKIIGNISFQSFEEANYSFHGKKKKNDPTTPLPIDILLAKVIFVLDIIDDENIFGDVLSKCGISVPSFEDARNDAEYTVRLSPAIVAENIMGKLDGDCIETLCRHLINIAIHDYGTNRFHIERLPAELRKYYTKSDKYFNKFKDNLREAPGLELFQSEAGKTNIKKHKSWKICLQNTITAMFRTRIGSDFYNEIICSQEMSNFCVSIG